jgi:hypothetical protein
MWLCSKRFLGAVALLAAAGCGGKERISLSATVRNVDLSVEQRVLGTFLTGGFDLVVRLGPNAPESTTAQLESVSLVRAGQTPTTLVAALALSGAPDQVELNPGQERTFSLTLQESDPVSADARDQICAAPVQITGCMTDTLTDDSTPFVSQQHTPSGCE